MPGELLSICSCACFVANSSGTLPTTSRVGSLTIGVRGSSDGTSTITGAVAFTNAWFEMIVPSARSGYVVTSN